MVRFLRAVLALSAFFLLATPIPRADAQQNPGYAKVVSSCGTLPAGVTYSVGTAYPITMDTTGKICNGSGTTPIPVIPGTLTYLGQQKFSAATLASSTALTLPTGATTANFFPECSASGTDGVCIRFNPGGAADATTSGPMGASLQFYLGETGALATLQVILATGATGATSTSPTLTVNYYK